MAMTLITTNTSSNATNSAFTASIDNTYKLYIFKFLDIGPATDAAGFTFNGSIDGGSNYNVTKTTTFFWALNAEDDSSADLEYSTGDDLSQSTAYQLLADGVGSAADESAAGTLWLFNPSNTTYVKHFYSRFNWFESGGYAADGFMSGYFNNADNIDAVDFKMSSGNFDGVIKMYGVG
jgi:hypothetical protein